MLILCNIARRMTHNSPRQEKHFRGGPGCVPCAREESSELRSELSSKVRLPGPIAKGNSDARPDHSSSNFKEITGPTEKAPSLEDQPASPCGVHHPDYRSDRVADQAERTLEGFSRLC
jgi:hypothetical protein